MKSLLLIGANGQLGCDIAAELRDTSWRLKLMTRSDVDLRDHENAAHLIQDLRPDVIVNTAAFHKVEACELDPNQAFAVNCLGVRNLAITAERIGARLVHFSTDYVFDGESDTPYAEGAVPGPINAYGTSKVAGEFFVRSICSRHLVIRTSGLYGLVGSSGKGGNFVQTMLRLGRERGSASVVNDQTLSPTYTQDLARAVKRLIESDASGLYHVTNSGSCTWFEFARAIFTLAGMPVDVQPVTTASTKPAARRPRFSVLANKQLVDTGFEPLRNWRDALGSYLASSESGVSSETTTKVAGVSYAAN